VFALCHIQTNQITQVNEPLFFISNLGAHTLLLQVVLNESGNTVYSGKELPSHKIKFNVTGMSFIVNLLVLPHIE
jgi:hypothetical protein